jgi:hypothetical protein
MQLSDNMDAGKATGSGGNPIVARNANKSFQPGKFAGILHSKINTGAGKDIRFLVFGFAKTAPIISASVIPAQTLCICRGLFNSSLHFSQNKQP